MRHTPFALLFFVALAACGSDDGGTGPTTGDPSQDPTTTGGTGTVGSSGNVGPTVGPDPSDPTKPAVDDPGPKPTATCNVTKDANGFFTRGGYVGYVPPTYDGNTPVHLVVGLHGCGDSAQNFATWAISPFDTRKKQEHIGISMGGHDGQCWPASNDPATEAAVMAAIADISSCYWVHQQKVVMAGYSSGGMVAYHIAMKSSGKFAGLIIENSGFYGQSDEDALLAAATNKFPIAHIAHKDDGDFPLSKVQPDWTKIKNAGFPITTSVVAGTHSGTSADWNNFLLPKVPAMKRP